MTQAFEISHVHHCTPRPKNWLGRARAWLAGWPATPGLVQLHNPSRHLMRDIGLGEEVRGNPLLQDHYLRR